MQPRREGGREEVEKAIENSHKLDCHLSDDSCDDDATIVNEVGGSRRVAEVPACLYFARFVGAR